MDSPMRFCSKTRSPSKFVNLMTILLLLTLLAAFSFNAGAGEKKHKMEKEEKQLFMNLDANNDNKLSVSEAEDNTVLMNDFDAVDKNGNNEIDISEFMAFEPVERFEPIESEESPNIGAAPTQ